MSDVAVAVIGGGISGLAAAYELRRREVPFVLLERSDRVGGVVRTDRVDGFTIDAGPDSLLAQKPAALELCAELGLGDQLVPTQPPRTAYVLRRGTLRPLPPASVFGIPTRVGPLVTSRLLSPAGKARLALDLVVPRRRAHTDESVASFFRRRFGREVVAYLTEPLLAGIHAGDVERLSMHALFPRLVAAEASHGSVIRAFRRIRAETGAARARDGIFRSLPGGLGPLIEAVAAALPPDALRRRAAVESLSGPLPYRIQCADGTVLAVDQVICAVPAHAAGPLLGRLSPEAGDLCAAIPYTSMATVVVGYPRAAVRHPLNGTGFVVPRAESGCALAAATWISSKWPARAPDGYVLLRGFVGGARAPDALDRSDDALRATVHDELARLLGIEAPPCLSRVYRWPRANPQPHVGHLDRMRQLDTHLAAAPGLQVIGAAFRGVGLPDCVAAGRAAGRTAAQRYRATR